MRWGEIDLLSVGLEARVRWLDRGTRKVTDVIGIIADCVGTRSIDPTRPKPPIEEILSNMPAATFDSPAAACRLNVGGVEHRPPPRALIVWLR